jgi:hypothetical protein
LLAVACRLRVGGGGGDVAHEVSHSLV